MKNAQILYDLRELQSTWRKNNFQLNEGQRVSYNNLLQLRRERVQQLYTDGRVFKGSKASFDKANEETETDTDTNS